jgi:hypothetical protein
MTDADGNFNISLYKGKRVNITYKIELRQDYHRGVLNTASILPYNISYLAILTSIASEFNSSVYARSRDLTLKGKTGTYKSYIVSVNSRENLSIVQTYFNKYPLLSSKYLDYIA